MSTESRICLICKSKLRPVKSPDWITRVFHKSCYTKNEKVIKKYSLSAMDTEQKQAFITDHNDEFCIPVKSNVRVCDKSITTSIIRESLIISSSSLMN